MSGDAMAQRMIQAELYDEYEKREKRKLMLNYWRHKLR